MKLGLVTDCLGYIPFNEMVKTAAGLGFQTLELATGNWSQAPHLNLEKLLSSAVAREEMRTVLEEHQISICALNCSGNQLAPGETGRRHHDVV
ncbi:hypothetical protein ACMYSL_12885 [Klebsiella sp. MISC125]|uniref:hypothetical protein n=1 Tax=Klebsiella sp. MISC125 TaxID=2755386 RepID=UPI003DA90411